ncbi:hypothetical protein AB0D11_09355 [Streptomyces monashensis]|uniref:hypothetical protein n=1 Tax=Streptomyces monashensis TaxID=1678012 RepID=UPI0033DD536E
MTEGNQGTGDERWNEFVREFEQSRGIRRPAEAGHESGTGGREPGVTRREATPGRPRRRRFVTATVVVAGAAAVVAGAGFWLNAGHGTADGAVARASAVSSERPARSSAAPPAMVTADQAFPARAAGYTKVEQSGGPHCTGSGMVGPDLTALIEASKGCRGVIGALYKDASDNQYTIVAFGMKDPVDVVRLVTALGSHPMDDEVGVLAPPAGSGLRTLPADSALVQSFAGRSRLLVVGLAQWSDGRGTDRQGLVGRLQPLMAEVTEAAAGHDRG